MASLRTTVGLCAATLLPSNSDLSGARHDRAERRILCLVMCLWLAHATHKQGGPAEQLSKVDLPLL